MQLKALFEIDRRERAALLIAFVYFFGLLTSYYMLRSVREAMGVRFGPEHYNWLYTGTFLCMVLGPVGARGPVQRLEGNVAEMVALPG